MRPEREPEQSKTLGGGDAYPSGFIMKRSAVICTFFSEKRLDK